MKKSLGAKGQQFPQEVFIVASYNEDGTPNAMNVAYAAQVTSTELAINISAHQSTDNILARRAFTVAPADAAHVVEADYFGITAGRKVNKAKGSKLTFTKAEHVDAPVIEELPLTMECEVTDIQDLGGEWRVVAKIVDTLADESILDEEGRVDFGTFRPICYDAAKHLYRVVDEVAGEAWSCGKALA